MATIQKTALITGCSSGIGHATAIELSQRGYKVFACARRLEPMSDLIQHGISIFKMDVSSEESIESGKEYILQQLHKLSNYTTPFSDLQLDVLYNNAGQSCTIPAADVTNSQMEECFKVNVFGPVNLTRTFLPYLINARGTIVFTGSLAGICPFPWGSIYGSSKAAIHQYANILALELEPFDVRVLNVVTGGVKTNIADTRGLSPSSIYYCDEVVESFELRKKFSDKNKPQDPKVYAKDVVNEVLYGNNWKVDVYKGTWAGTLGMLVWLVPRWLVVSIFRVRFRLTGVFKTLRERNDKKKIN